MKNVMRKVAPGLFALFAAGSVSVSPAQDFARPQGQYDPSRARVRDLEVLEDDLRTLDDALATVSRRSPRYDEFTRRAIDVRNEVSSLADCIRNDRPGWRDGRGGSREEIDALRASI